jgi:hypothetical protein
MNLRWLWFDPIPRELEVPKEAREVVARRMRKLELDRNFRADLLRGLVNDGAVTLTFAIGSMLLWAYNQFLLSSLMFAACLLYCWTLSRRWLDPLKSKCGRLSLCQLGYLCCLRCGYAHTGLSKDVKECPECGAAREFGKCIHCNSPQEWAMQLDDKCTQCGRMRLS